MMGKEEGHLPQMSLRSWDHFQKGPSHCALFLEGPTPTPACSRTSQETTGSGGH